MRCVVQQFNPEEFYKLLTVAEGRVVRDRECSSANVPKYIVEKLGLRGKDPVESTPLPLFSFLLCASCSPLAAGTQQAQ